MTQGEAYAKVKQLAAEARGRGWLRVTVPKSRPPGGLTCAVLPGVRGEVQCVTERTDGAPGCIVVALVRVDQLDRWLARFAAWRTQP